MPCRLSALIPAIVAGALAGGGTGWLLSMAEWILTGDRAVFGFGSPGYITLVCAGAAAGALIAYRTARRSNSASCVAAPPGRRPGD
jgi:hypothetical protein